MKRKPREEGELFQRVRNAALPYVTVILDRMGIVYRQRGHEIQLLNPMRPDRHFGSFSINLTTGRWAEFATGDKGGDLISLVAYLKGERQIDAAKDLARMLGMSDE